MITSSIIGRLCSDPEVRNTTGGTVVSFSIASNDKVRGEDRATFLRVSIWGKRGEAFASFHSKGDLAFVSGTVSTAKFRGRDGQERESLELDCTAWTFTGGKKADSGGGRQRQQEVFTESDPYSGGDNVPF